MMCKKVCLLGSAAVGKTSLVHRVVHRAYSETYLPTIGVRIDKRECHVDGRDVVLLAWDTGGQAPRQVRRSYLTGASGYLLVADGTRRTTFDAACALQAQVDATLGPVPFVLIVNKADLRETWEVDEADLRAAGDRGWAVWQTSAKAGDSVEDAFHHLARRMLSSPRSPRA